MTVTVRDLPLTERPRERLASLGAESLSAQELLSVVLSRGVAGHSVTTISEKLLHRFGSLSGVVSASLEDLQTIEGLGPAKALQLKACLEIAQRVIAEKNEQEKVRQTATLLTDPESIAQLVRTLVRDTHKEHLFVICGDSRGRIIACDLVAVGTVNASVAHPREIYERAVSRHATVIAIAHNHPSGDPTPSEADQALTMQLSGAGRVMGITLIDHVVVTQTSWYSFREQKHI